MKKKKTRKSVIEVRDAIAALYAGKPAGTVVSDVTDLMSTVVASRPTVKSALDNLLREGVLTYRETRGLIVTGFDGKIGLEQSEIGHVLELRLGLEPIAARSAARAVHTGRASAERRAAFEAAYRRLTDAFGKARDVRGAFVTDRGFHQAAFGLVENPLLAMIVERIDAWLKLNVQDVVTTLFADPSYRADTQREHDAIFAAIINGQPDEAFEAARTHLTTAHARIMRKLRRARG